MKRYDGNEEWRKKSVVEIIIFSRKVSIDKRGEHIPYICFGILFSELNVCVCDRKGNENRVCIEQWGMFTQLTSTESKVWRVLIKMHIKVLSCEPRIGCHDWLHLNAPKSAKCKQEPHGKRRKNSGNFYYSLQVKVDSLPAEIIMRKISMNFKTNTNIVQKRTSEHTRKANSWIQKKVMFKFCCNNELFPFRMRSETQ